VTEHAWTLLASAPSATARDAAVSRSSCGVTSLRPAVRTAGSNGGVLVTAVVCSRGPAVPTPEQDAGCLGRWKGAARRFAMGLRPTPTSAGACPDQGVELASPP
jgi:hypothetical protein